MQKDELTEEQNCLNCHFFLQTSERGNQKIGYCRANPPQYHEEKEVETGMIVPKIGRFPVVLNGMWCGMWDYKEK